MAVSGLNQAEDKVAAGTVLESVSAGIPSVMEFLAALSDLHNDHTPLLPDPHTEHNTLLPSQHDDFTTVMSQSHVMVTHKPVYETDVNTTWIPETNSLRCSSETSFMTTLPWIRIIFGLLMVLENCVSLVALWRVKRMQHAMHSFISSLAVAELLTGVWCCYRFGAEILVGVNEVTLECRLRFVGITYLNFAAFLSVSALCLDSCVALYEPFHYGELVSKRRVKAVLAAVWILPVMVVMTAYVHTTDSGQKECVFVNIASQRTYIVLTVLRCCLIAFIIVSELLIFRSARCQIVKIYPSVFSSRNSNRLLRMNAKAAVNILAVLVPFLLLYLPVLLVQGNLAVRPHLADSCQSQLLAFVWLCASAHGLFTPIVFCWRFTEVRENLLRTLKCWWTRPSRSSVVFHLRTDNSGSTA
ncbi:hypothetical protein ACOMHN_029713 [Nucella lapillus]